MRITRRIVTASLLAMALSAPAFADDKPLILLSVPGMNFPFFVHMMNDGLKVEAAKQGFSTIEGDGQNSSPKQTADIEAALTKGVKGIVISPIDVDAMAPALQEAIDAKVPVVTVDRRVPSVTGILGHVGADNVKGGEAQGNLIVKMFPNGATIVNLQGQPGASPAIDRNKGLHNVLDKAGDKYKIVAEQTANFHRDEGLKVTESMLAGMSAPPQVINRRERRHGARRDRGGQGAQPQGHHHHRLRRAARGAGEGARRRTRPRRSNNSPPSRARPPSISWPNTSRAARSRSSRSRS